MGESKNLIPKESDFLLYTTPEGNVKIEVFFQNETVWLTQNQMVDLFNATKQNISLHINNIFKEAAEKPEWKGILKVVEDPIVSTDILGEPYGSIVDLNFTRVVDGDLVKIFSWYDNEWGYGAMLLKHIEALKNIL